MRITPEEAYEGWRRGELQLVDSRSAASWAASDREIPDSLRVPPDQVDEHIGPLPRGRPIVTYCT